MFRNSSLKESNFGPLNFYVSRQNQLALVVGNLFYLSIYAITFLLDLGVACFRRIQKRLQAIKYTVTFTFSKL